MKIADMLGNLSRNKSSYYYLIIILIFGVSLIITGNKNSEKNILSVSTPELASDIYEENYATQEDDLKRNLISILKKAKGVGDIDIYINYSSTKKKIPLREKDNNMESKVVFKNEGSKNEPYISTELSPQVEGVIIVAQGGDDDYVKSLLKNTVSTVLGVPIHRINVLKMG